MDKAEFIGKNSIILGEKTITFPAPIRFIETFDEVNIPKIVILFSLNESNVAVEPINNLQCFDNKGNCLWTIKDLIRVFNEENKQFKINEESLFFCMKKLDFNMIYAYEFICHYYIHVPRGKLIYLEGHK